MNNCKFYNNTSDGYFSSQAKGYQGTSGGLSIGYNMSNPNITVNITITDCEFINNSASPLPEFRISPTKIIKERKFTGRGGGLSVLVSIHFSQLSCIIKNCKFVNNFATDFGGAIYIFIAHVFNHQTYKIDSNTFINNWAPISGALSLIDVRKKSKNFTILTTVLNCTFKNNLAYKSAGAVGMYSVMGWTNYSLKFENCGFYDNTALTFNGGAVDLESYNFYENKDTLCPTHFINW